MECEIARRSGFLTARLLDTRSKNFYGECPVNKLLQPGWWGPEGNGGGK